MSCQTPSLSLLLHSRFLFTIERASFDTSGLPAAAQAECAGARAVQLHVCHCVHASCPAPLPCLSGLGAFQMLSELQKGSGGCWKKRLCGSIRGPCARAQTLGTAIPGAQRWPPGSLSLSWACSWALGVLATTEKAGKQGTKPSPKKAHVVAGMEPVLGREQPQDQPSSGQLMDPLATLCGLWVGPWLCQVHGNPGMCWELSKLC